jgi:hypothetical protein
MCCMQDGHQVYLVVQYSQVSYSLGVTVSGQDGTWGMIWHEIGAAGVGILK